ncbi:MAG: hypothetical protein AAGF20_00855 [Pseudomonadota bacterium]
MSNWPTDPLALVTAAEVAARLRYKTVGTFYSARRTLREQGFPEPACGRHWTASQISDWLAHRAAAQALNSASSGLCAANDAAPCLETTSQPAGQGAGIDEILRHRLARLREAAKSA